MCLFTVYLQHTADCLKSTSDDHFDIFERKIAADVVKQASLNYDCHWESDQVLCVRYGEHKHWLESGGSLEKWKNSGQNKFMHKHREKIDAVSQRDSQFISFYISAWRRNGC